MKFAPIDDPTMAQLFRDEVVQRRLSEIGVPLGVAGCWTRVFVAVLSAALIAGFILVTMGSYSRKSRVSGFLVPDKGLIKVMPLHVGRVTELRVMEGQHVEKDRIVAVIDVSAITLVGRTADLVVEKLKERRKLLREELERLGIIQTSDRDKLDASIGSLRNQIEAMKIGLAARKDFRRLSKNAFDRNKLLEIKEVYSPAQSEKAEQDMVSADVQIAELERAMVMSQGDLAQAEAQRRGLADHQANDRSQLERTLAEIEQQIVQIEEQRFQVVRANESGVATGLVATIGAPADPKVPLMTIVPDQAELEANLYVPSSAAGFVKVGAQVLIRY